MDTLKKLGIPADVLTDEGFNEMFNSIDDDGSGVLGRDEMVILIK